MPGSRLGEILPHLSSSVTLAVFGRKLSVTALESTMDGVEGFSETACALEGSSIRQVRVI